MRRTLAPKLQENFGTKLDVSDVFKPNAGDDLRRESCRAGPYYGEEHKPRVAGSQMTKFSRLVPNFVGPQYETCFMSPLLAPRILRFVTVGGPGNSLDRNYRGADKSLAQPGRKQATATEDFDFHTSYL